MKAVALAGPGRLEETDLADPSPGEGEIVVAVAYCGICGSDQHEYTSQAPSLRAGGLFQPVMGHEFSGTVVARGPGVRTPAPRRARCSAPGRPVWRVLLLPLLALQPMR